MTIERGYELPGRFEGEDNWEWCRRAAASIPAESLMRMVVAHLDRKEKRRRSSTWVVLSDMFGHGSGVSNAIVERFRGEEQPHDHA